MPAGFYRFMRVTMLQWCLGGFVIIGLTACGGVSTQSSEKPIPCPPDTGSANVYRATPHPWTSIIYQFSGMAVSLPTANPDGSKNSISDGSSLIPVTAPQTQFDQSRYAALQFLMSETKRWSDIKSFKLDNSSEIYIIVTFIHPELVQAVYLNDILRTPHLIPEIEKQINEAMNKVASRDELVFLVTVIIHNFDSLNITHHLVDLPVGNMQLINAEGLGIPPLHNDQNIDQPFSSSQNSVFGFLGYPIGVQSKGRCVWVLDTTYNTNIVIVAEPITIDGASNGPATWTIRYQSLIDTGIPLSSPDFSLPPNYDPGVFSPLSTPPVNLNDTNFWRDLSRFVWGQIAFEK